MKNAGVRCNDILHLISCEPLPSFLCSSPIAVANVTDFYCGQQYKYLSIGIYFLPYRQPLAAVSISLTQINMLALSFTVAVAMVRLTLAESHQVTVSAAGHYYLYSYPLTPPADDEPLRERHACFPVSKQQHSAGPDDHPRSSPRRRGLARWVRRCRLSELGR